MEKKGKFIVIEGTECAGKTTQVKNVAHALRDKGIDIVESREPGGRQSANIYGPFPKILAGKT